MTDLELLKSGLFFKKAKKDAGDPDCWEVDLTLHFDVGTEHGRQLKELLERWGVWFD